MYASMLAIEPNRDIAFVRLNGAAAAVMLTLLDVTNADLQTCACTRIRIRTQREREREREF